MKNVTVSLPEETASWARVWAAKKGMSVSAALSELLDEKRKQDQTLTNAFDVFLSVPARDLNSGNEYHARDELYER